MTTWMVETCSLTLYNINKTVVLTCRSINFNGLFSTSNNVTERTKIPVKSLPNKSNPSPAAVMRTNSEILSEDVRHFSLFKSTDVWETENLLNKHNIFLVLGSKDPTKTSSSSYWDPKIQQAGHCFRTGIQKSNKIVIYVSDIRQTSHRIRTGIGRSNKHVTDFVGTQRSNKDYSHSAEIRRPNKHVNVWVLEHKDLISTSSS